VKLEHEVVRRILDHRDLLEDDLALEGEVGVTQERAEHDVGDHVRGVREMRVEHSPLIDRVFARRVRVERAAECFEG
jgi:hypothetical protein